MKNRIRIAVAVALATATTLAPASADLTVAPTAAPIAPVQATLTEPIAAAAPAGVFRRVLPVAELPGVTLRPLTAADQRAILKAAPVPAGVTTKVVETSIAALGNYVVVTDVTGTATQADAWFRLLRLAPGATQGELLLETHGRRTADQESAAAAMADAGGPVKDPSYQQAVAPECPTEPVLDQLLKCGAFLYAAYRAGQRIGYDVYQACRRSADDCDQAVTIVSGVVAAGCDFTRPADPGPYECYYGNLELYYESTPAQCLTGSSCMFRGRAEPGVTRHCQLCSPMHVTNRIRISYYYVTPDGSREQYYDSIGGFSDGYPGMQNIGYGTEFDTFIGGFGDDTYQCATDISIWWDVYWRDGSGSGAYVNPRGDGKYMTNGYWSYVHEPARSCLGLPG